MTEYKAPSIRRAFEVIDYISKAKGGVGTSEVSRGLGLSKATVHGIVKALCGIGALIQSPGSRKYILGPTLLELGRVAHSQMDLKDLARPLMEHLMEATKGTVYLGVLNDSHVTILEVVESTLVMKITSPKGTTIPLFAAAVGKVMLTFFDEETQNRYLSLGLPRFTDKTVTDPELFLNEVRRAKALGYATDMEEYIPGVWAVAAPIKRWMGIPAAIWVVGFKAALAEHPIEELGHATRKVAQRIDQAIGR